MSEILRKFNEGQPLVDEQKWDEAEKYYWNLLEENRELDKLMGNYWLQRKYSPLKKEREMANQELKLLGQMPSEILTYLAKIYIHSKQCETGLEKLLDETKRYLKSPQLQTVVLELFARVKKLKEAEEYLRSQIKAAPYEGTAYLLLIDFLIEQKRIEDARKMIDIVLGKKSDFAPAWNAKGHIFMQENQLEQAEEAFRKAIEYFRKYEVAWENLGLVQMRKEQLQEAEKSFNRVISLNSKNVKSRVNLGIIYRFQKRFDESLLQFQESLKIQPDSAMLQLEYAKTLDLSGKREEAKKIYSELLKYNYPVEIKNQIKERLQSI